MVFFMKLFVQVLHNKMVWQNAKTDISLKLLELFLSVPIYLNIIGWKP
jgi:hypothetical protein